MALWPNVYTKGLVMERALFSDEQELVDNLEALATEVKEGASPMALSQTWQNVERSFQTLIMALLTKDE
jgi:enoyl-CoA hydratase/carnithine racemase